MIVLDDELLDDPAIHRTLSRPLDLIWRAYVAVVTPSAPCNSDPCFTVLSGRMDQSRKCRLRT